MRIHPENSIKTRGYGVLQGRLITVLGARDEIPVRPVQALHQ